MTYEEAVKDPEVQRLQNGLAVTYIDEDGSERVLAVDVAMVRSIVPDRFWAQTRADLEATIASLQVNA